MSDRRDRDRRGERGGRSWDGDRGRDRHSPDRHRGLPPGHHTNSDNPRLLNSRVFIGNLPTDRVSRDEVKEMFEKYGNILGVSVLKGFGFVQFDREEDARKSVMAECGSLLKGNVLDVKMAAEGRKPGGGGGARAPPSFDRSERSRERDRSPPRFPRGGGAGIPSLFDEPISRSKSHDSGRRGESQYPAYPDPYGPQIDALIIGTEPKARMYAEMVNKRLKSSTIITDMCILPDESHVVRATEAIANRGVLYLITVNAANEQHRSMTLNIRHGTPQEHRNMPLEDALSLVTRNFAAYLKELREKTVSGGTTTSTVVPASGGGFGEQFQPPDEETCYLLNLVADNRALTLAELDRILDYLKLRRDQQAQVENPGGRTSAKGNSNQYGGNQMSREQAADLQDILGNGNMHGMQQQAPGHGQQGMGMMAGGSRQQNASANSNVAAASTNINFDNPNVQKALDDLISSGPNLLRNITSSMHDSSAGGGGIPSLMQQTFPASFSQQGREGGDSSQMGGYGRY